MAHELWHVLLRHGTANATKAEGFQLGALAGAIAGAVIGGGWGQAISQGSQFGLGTWLLKYSREYEKQADLLGSQIMARAGYDPRDLAHMFETIQKQGNGAPPQWLSSHPNPGNRTQYITQEASQLQIARASGRQADSRPRRGASRRCHPPSRWRSSRKSGGASRGEDTTSVGTVGEPVPAPSAQYRQVRGGRLFEASVPANWTAVASNASVKYVPQNGYGELQGQTVLTHGVELGVARASSRDLREATDTLVDSFMQGNPGMRVSGSTATVRISGRTGLGTPLSGRSALGGDERVGLYTTLLADGNLFYYVTVVPEREASRYAAAFDRIGQSIRLSDR